MKDNTVKIGASVPEGVGGLKLLQQLKLGNMVLTKIPTDFKEAMAVATYCRRNQIHFAFSEFLHRGSKNLLMSARRQVARKDFFTRAQLDAIMAAGGKYYLGRMTLGEAGGLLYWPRQYVIGRACGNYISFPPAKTVEEACRYYVDFMRQNRSRTNADSLADGFSTSIRA